MSPGARAVSCGLRAVVLAVPLATFPGVLAPFDAPKAWWLQAIVIVTALAWVLQHAQSQAPSTFARPDRSQAWLLSLVAAYAGWWVLTTITSVAPGQSMLGSFARGFGLLTVLAAIALFPLVQSHCRTVDSGRSLIDAALLGSVPVCVLALGQAFGWNGLPGTVDPATNALRVRSTLGQHVFLGSYLVALIPLTAVRFAFSSRPAERVRGSAIGLGAAWVLGVPLLVWLASTRPFCWPLLPLWGLAAAIAWDSGLGAPADAGGSRGFSRRAILGALLTGQVLVVTLCGARGPFLGVIIALALTVGAMWWSRRTKVARPVMGSIVVLVCLGVALATLMPRLGPLRTVPATDRLVVKQAGARDSANVRLRVWSAILDHLGRQAVGQEVIPGQDPWLRTAVGYGLDTQEFILGTFTTDRGGGGPHSDAKSVRFGFDRAHNVLLDHVATGGLVAAGLWIVLLAGLAIVGMRRLHAVVDEEWALRLGCLGAGVGHLVEGNFGIETAMSSALFWITAALLTVPVSSHTSAVEARSARALWMALLVGLAVAGTAVMAATSVWLLGSAAYTNGLFSISDGRTDEAQLEMLQATRLVPWLPAPRIALAELGFQVALRERDPALRSAVLRYSEAMLAEAPRGVSVSADFWIVRGRIALTRVVDGERDQLQTALASFAIAHRFRPNVVGIMSPWSLALVLDGQVDNARELARLVLSRNRLSWITWAVLARSSRQLGDWDTALYAAEEARRRVPPREIPLLERLL